MSEQGNRLLGCLLRDQRALLDRARALMDELENAMKELNQLDR